MEPNRRREQKKNTEKQELKMRWKEEERAR